VFTGLIQTVGVVRQLNPTAVAPQTDCATTPPPSSGETLAALGQTGLQTGLQLAIEVPLNVLGPLAVGASLAVNGCCLTVTQPIQPDDQLAWFDVSAETCEKTTLSQLKSGQKVNLEAPLTVGTPLGGHWVTGHIDGTVTLVKATYHGNSWVLRFKVNQPDRLPMIVEKGSIAIDGISLTVNTVIQDTFSVAIIPHTWQHTTLHQHQVGDVFNIETDIIGRYVHHFMTVGRVASIYDQQASTQQQQAALGAGSTVGVVNPPNMHLGQWFNGAPC
jgi:riboflavin synthase